MKNIFFFLFLLTASVSNAQTGTDNRTYLLTDLSEKPALISDSSIEAYFKKNFHPSNAVGAVDISFVIEKAGVAHSITLFKVDDAQAKMEAERVLKTAGKWKPGMKDGKVVRVLYRFTYQPNVKK